MTVTFATTRELTQDYWETYDRNLSHNFWYEWSWGVISGSLTVYIMIGGYFSFVFMTLGSA